MRRFTALLLVFTAFCGLCACSAGTAFRDDVAVSDLLSRAVGALDDGVEYTVAGKDYLSDYLTVPSDADDAEILFAADGNNLNEFGVFHVTGGKAKEFRKQIEDYLDTSLHENRSFYDSYIPEETPKLREAETRQYGNYVVYAVLESAGKAAVFRTVRDALKESF